MLEAVDRVSIHTVVENYVDMLLPDQPYVRRFGMLDHFFPPRNEPLVLENGLAFLIEWQRGDIVGRVLFDTSLTGRVLLHNLAALGLATSDINDVVISHAHPDHFGGLESLLEHRQRTHQVATRVYVHHDAFYPKYIVDDDWRRLHCINEPFNHDALAQAGADWVNTAAGYEIAPGIAVTGFVPRVTSFEPPNPPRPTPAGIYRERDGRLERDDDPVDDQAVVINVKGKGLIVLTACGHSGVINTITRARQMTGVDRVYALMGGFHLGFPGVPAENATRTVAAIRESEIQVVAPMHCTGFQTQCALHATIPDRYLVNTTGTSVEFVQPN